MAPVATHVVSPFRKKLRWAIVGILALMFPLMAIVMIYPPKPQADEKSAQISGFWGPRTANTNWCEADYAVTFYTAECWNTVTSILITVHGVWGLWKHGWAETRSALAFFAMLVVGIGSTMFHATLWRSMQLMDELPMLWGNCVFMFQLYTMQIPRGRSTLKEFAGVAVFAVVATAAIILFDDDDQNIFLLCYGGGVVYVVYKGLKMDKLYNAKNVVLYEFALLFYGGGLLLWTLDRVYCSSVQRFHFHAIWHVCASTGTYLSVCTWVYLREAAMKGDPRVRGPFGFQYVEPGRAV